jgi:two-component system sensor histidine kinase KdpD
VAKGFTEAMGGTIATEDTPGGGLTFVLDLPAGSPRQRPGPILTSSRVVDDDAVT